jgi:two-component system, sensor histidine kinase LadS
MKIGKYIIICLLVLNINPSVHASSVYYYIDKDREVNDLNTAAGLSYIKLDKNSLNLGFYDGQVWLKVLPDSSSEILEFLNPNLDEIHFYQDGTEYLAGDLYPFRRKPIQTKYFRFPVKDRSHSIFVRISNHGDQFYLPVRMTTEQNIKTFDFSDQFINGLYYGLLIFVFLLNLFMFVVIRERENFFYVLYIAGLFFLQFSLAGYAFQFIWPDSAFWANRSLPLFASLSVYFLAIFVLNFLKIKEFNLRAYQFLRTVSYILLGNIVLSLFPGNFSYRSSIWIINIITLILNIMIIPIALKIWSKHFKPARFFSVAFFLLIFSVFIFILRNIGAFESNIWTNNVLYMGSSAEVVLLTFAIVDKFKVIKEESLTQLLEINELKTRQNLVLENRVQERTKQIMEQKEELALKNKDITDSIRYAKRIQDALMPTPEKFREYFSDAFIFYRPRDIVSGDFYWISKVESTFPDSENKDYTVFGLGDSTGHGVPGAILSVIGIKILNESLKISEINNPAQALDYLNVQIDLTLNKNSENESIKDGMDIAICALEKKESNLYFAGSRNGIILVRNKTLTEYNGDRISIGEHGKNRTFSLQKIKIEKGDIIYFYTDGFPDQFGGERNRKFMYRNFNEFLLSISDKPMAEQHTLIEEKFISWKGDNAQVDDVTVAGIKI